MASTDTALSGRRRPPVTRRASVLLLACAAAAASRSTSGAPVWVSAEGAAHAAGCVAVPLDKCGMGKDDSCLECSTGSEWDCAKCCPGCILENAGGLKYCACEGPAPGPAPSPGAGSWARYEIAGMDVLSLTAGRDEPYEKVVIMLHGGGGSGADWVTNYDKGWFGELRGLKYVFPTTAYPDRTWYESYKNGCGLAEVCAYNLSSIEESASNINTLVEHERRLVGGDAANVFLAGFSQGGQMTAYMQIAKLDFALGGTIVWSAFPLPPLGQMPGQDTPTARSKATYYGDDMRWVIVVGEFDFIFPASETMDAFLGMFDALDARSTLKRHIIEPDLGHDLVEREFEEMIAFVRAE